MSAGAATDSRKKLSAGTKRGIQIGVIALVLLGIVFGTRVVSSDNPLAQGAVDFDAATFGSDNFPKIQSAVAEKAVDAKTLSDAIAADPDAAAKQYAVPSSGGPVFAVSFTGVVGEGQSGIYDVKVDGLPENLRIRVQTGPAVNGTDLRDATGDVTFGQFRNQIDFQNAAAALNEELKNAVLATVDTSVLGGKTIEVTGAFTLVNPAAWLVTPVELSEQ